MKRQQEQGAAQKQTERLRTVPPLQWTIDDVVAWLATKDLSHLAPLFRKHRVDGEGLCTLTQAEYAELEITVLGDRKKLHARLTELLQQAGLSSPGPGVGTDTGTLTAGTHRPPHARPMMHFYHTDRLATRPEHGQLSFFS